MDTHKIAVIDGDGIGPEVMAQGIKVLEQAAVVCGFRLEFIQVSAGGRCYKECGSVLPSESLRACKESEAIFKAPAGLPDLPQGLVEREMILTLRQELDLFVNLRPVKLLEPLYEISPLKKRILKNGIDLVLIRENSEGLYSKHGGISKSLATDINLFTRQGVDRIINYAFEWATKNKREGVTSVDKANVLFTSKFWRERFNNISKDYANIRTESIYVDAMAQYLIRSPDKFDVIVVDNMFGDILSDLAVELIGSLGMGPSANINPGGISMFEPIAGSAPDIANKGVANPIGQILAGKMMLETLGRQKAANIVEKAVIETLNKGYRTKDLTLPGEKYLGTDEMGSKIASIIKV